MITAVERLKLWTRRLQAEVYALYLAYEDPRVRGTRGSSQPAWWGTRSALLDLIPGPATHPRLPLDDLILISLGIALAVRLIPPDIFAECRKKARPFTAEGKSMSKKTAAVAVAAVGFSLAVLATFFCDAVVEEYPFKDRLLSKGSLCYDFKDRVRREPEF
jgi:hypothetical protein